MKIHVIGQALDEIKEEDQQALKNLEEELSRIESTYSIQKEEVKRLKDNHKRYEELDRVVNDEVKRLHMILPILELPIGVILIILSLVIAVPNMVTLLAVIIAMIFGVDAINTLIEKYPSIKDAEINGLKAYIDAFKKLLLGKKDLRHLMINAYNKFLNAKSEANTSELELNRTRGKIDDIKRELLHLEGYISSIEYIVEKQYFEELSDNNDIVQFINKKKELKRVADQ